MTVNDTKDENRGSGLGRFLMALLRLLLLLAVGILIGVAGYFGVQFLYQQATAPAAANTRRLEGFETRQAGQHQQLDERLAQFQERLTALEARADVSRNELDSMQASLQTLEDSLQQLDQNLGGLGRLQTDLEIEFGKLSYDWAWERTQTAWARLTPSPTPPLDDLQRLSREVKLLQAMELLSRSRLHFLAGDYGLAEKDIQTAAGVLEVVQETAPTSQTADYQEILTRLEQAASSLPAAPAAAESDLEIAWDGLVDILTYPIETATPTSTPDAFQDIETLTPPFSTHTATPANRTMTAQPTSTFTPTVARTATRTPTAR